MMKKLRDNSIKHVLLLGIVLSAWACNDILEAEELNAIDQERVFNDPEVATLAINQLYNVVLPGFSALSNLKNTDDVFEDIYVGPDTKELIYGNYTDPGVDETESLGAYSVEVFGYVREVNLLLEGIQGGSISEEDRNPLLGQLYFMRAWLYWDRMVKDYGGVPIVSGILDVNDGFDNHLPRATTAESVQFIIDDLDQAMNMLGDYGSKDYGRFTRAAAAAFKGRVLLFYASPMYVPDGMTNADGLPDRWQAAYNANLEARQIAEASGHALHPDFTMPFLDESNPVEAIYLKRFSTVNQISNSYTAQVLPYSMRGDGLNPVDKSSPNWDFVSCFPMKDGFPIGEGSYTYDAEAYWYNRDPRLAAIVGYNSAHWPSEDNANHRVWTYDRNADNRGFEPNAGFYLRKNAVTNESIDQTGKTDWIEIRFTEVLLNLAESANEIGNQSEARSILYEIRERAGIEQGTGNYGIADGLTKTQLRAVIMNERRIELSFENKRYWDLRRRNMYENGLDGTSRAGLNGTRRQEASTFLDSLYVISIVPGLDTISNPDTQVDSVFAIFEREMRDTIDWEDPERYKAYFITEIGDLDEFDIEYLQPKYNFFHLPTRAVEYNMNLEQTILWPDGTFDPLAE